MVNKPVFNEVYTEFYPRIRRYLARKAGETEAEDLAQTVFLRVSRALPGFRGESSLATWIYRIAANVVIDRARGMTPEETTNECPDNTLARADIWSDGPLPDVDQTLVRKEMNACIRGLVDKLPEQSRSLIKLSEYEGLKNSEIAEVMGTSLGNVKIRLHRARLQLKEKLNAQCRVYVDERSELVCDPKHCR